MSPVVQTLVIIGMAVLLLPVVVAQTPHSLQVSLRLNTTEGTVYIPSPGVGEIPASALPTATYSSPSAFFLTSTRSSLLHALVFSQQTTLALRVTRNATHHFLTVSQNLSRSQVLLAFTRGDHRTVQNRILAIEGGSFLADASPSFAYALGGKNPLQLLLRYGDIDLQGTRIFRQGLHQLTLESNKTDGRKIVLVNETFG